MDQSKTFLGIELGSTRIKAVLIDEKYQPIAVGSHTWENQLQDGIWTYALDAVWAGLQDCIRQLIADYQKQYAHSLPCIDAMGVSAMMHGYLVFDQGGRQLTPFRTWRNMMTQKAAEQLTQLFGYNIPQRWSIAHLYQAILREEPHVAEIRCMTTLAGYVHWKLTGQKVLGIGEASGMFPIDSQTGNYSRHRMDQFQMQIAHKNYPWTLEQILPAVLQAGEPAGRLTEEGAKLLDPTGEALQAGIALCPPEGDAGTGMVATNSVAERTGNVSAGTSVFAMVVLEHPLSNMYPEIDLVTTPAGRPVAMVHCNNCTSDLDAWVSLFSELLETAGAAADRAALYDALYQKALEGDADCGGILTYNYYAGEPVTGLNAGRPLLTRMPDSPFTLANFMRSLLLSTMGTLKLGVDILTEREQVKLEQLQGHGGFFKTPEVGQRLMAAAFEVPVVVMNSAGEGGAWGIALLAAYMQQKGAGESLEQYLERRVFSDRQGTRISPDPADVRGFQTYMHRYQAGLAIEQAAVQNLT